MENIVTIKTMLCTVVSCVGSLVARAFGGWDAGLITLVLFMAVDYITGLMVAGVFHASEKTESGGLESRAGWKGLCRKGVTMLIVLIAQRIDIVAGTSVVRDAVVIAYIVNETISITENAGLMGVPVPDRLMAAIDVLQGKGTK